MNYMEVKKFCVNHVTDLKEMIKLGFKPVDIIYYEPRGYLRFVFEDVNNAREVFENVKDNRQKNKKFK